MKNKKIIEKEKKTIIPSLKKNNFIIYNNKEFNLKKDIDIHCKKCTKKNFKIIEEYFKKKGYVKDKIKEYAKYRVRFLKFITEKDLIILDFYLSKKYLEILNSKIDWKKIEEIKDKEEKKIVEKIIKYFLELKTEKKYSEYIKKHEKILKKYKYLEYFFKKKIYKNTKKMTTKKFILIMKRNIKEAYKNLTLKNFLYYTKTILERKKNYFLKGKIIAFIGLDGVGKTTLIELLKKNLGCKTQYMGNKNYYIEKYINLKKANIILKIISFITIYIEEWITYFKIRYYKLRGEIVLTDRYYKYEKILKQKYYTSKTEKIIYFLFYKYLYPNADEYIFVYENYNTIKKRKKEINKKQYGLVLEYFKKNFKNKKNFLFLENKNIKDSLNKILKKIYE